MSRNAEPEDLGLCRYCHCAGGHIPGCPEYQKPPICVCEICNENVYAGDPFIMYQSHTFHSDCFLEKYEQTE